MMIGVVGIKGGWSSEGLAEALEKRTGRCILFGMEEIALNLDSGRAVTGSLDVSSLDALVIKKIGAVYSPDMLDRLETLRYLADTGMPIFSSPLSILRVLNRLTCTVTLRAANIPMPPTTVTEDLDLALDALADYGKAVFKPLYTSKARGMTVIEHGPGARAAVADYQRQFPIMYLQKVIDLGERDLGLAFLGGEYLTTYARAKTNGAWNTTTASGGKYRPFDPDASVIDLAAKAADLFDLDFTTVDVALTKDGPMVFEVSAFGGFRGLSEARGIDAAGLYADYVIGKVSK